MYLLRYRRVTLGAVMGLFIAVLLGATLIVTPGANATKSQRPSANANANAQANAEERSAKKATQAETKPTKHANTASGSKSSSEPSSKPSSESNPNGGIGSSSNGNVSPQTATPSPTSEHAAAPSSAKTSPKTPASDSPSDNKNVIGHRPVTVCHKPGTPAAQQLTFDAEGIGKFSKSLADNYGIKDLTKRDKQILATLDYEAIRTQQPHSMPETDLEPLGLLIYVTAAQHPEWDHSALLRYLLPTGGHFGHGDHIGECGTIKATDLTSTATTEPEIEHVVTPTPITISDTAAPITTVATAVLGTSIERNTPNTATVNKKGLLAQTGAAMQGTVFYGIALLLIGLACLLTAHLRNRLHIVSSER